MEKLESDLEKFNRAREVHAAEHQRMIKAVDEYLEGQVTETESKEDILKKYFEEYEDIREVPLVKTMKTSDRMENLKRAIYMNEVRPLEKKKEKEKEETKKAA
ncbi:MAG: hypothetical protein A3J76_04605 [Candidatus Moranbacteria bacterium RBG_13_45_13]|nr:MAG: hypothetical protein A3J76_04605 [Candidatus Moranbacteria bacterium RBG_13_45_13]